MLDDLPRERLGPMLLLVFVILAPAFVVVVTVAFFVFTGDLLLSGVTPLELLELYLLELVVVAGLAYAIYRVLRWMLGPGTEDWELFDALDDEE